MIDLSKFTYYELETLKSLVDNAIRLDYKMKDKHPSVYSHKDKEIEELMLIQVKITQSLNTMEAPSNMQRFKDKKMR